MPLTPVQYRLIDAAANIRADAPKNAQFQHSVLCQIGLPRKKIVEKTFERRSGPYSLLLRAGPLWTGTEWAEQPLPYGSRPRIALVHLASEAVRTQNPVIDVGDSLKQFLTRIGIDTSGGARGGYTMFKKQMAALAACELLVGAPHPRGGVETLRTAPIERFHAWLSMEQDQVAFWPGEVHLSEEFFGSLMNHAVPLDPRALASLTHSSLAFDIYTWLAYRLRGVDKREGVRVSWRQLHGQFGQEYDCPKNFRRKFKGALRQVLTVYPDARIESVEGGLRLRPSPPPVGARRQFQLPG